MNNHGYPPLAEQECGNCRYSRATIGRSDDVLSCRRHAPTLTEVRQSDQDKTCWGWFPAVASSIWCGEWAPQEVDR